MAGSVPNTNKFFRYSHMNRSSGLHKMQIEAVEVRKVYITVYCLRRLGSWQLCTMGNTWNSLGSTKNRKIVLSWLGTLYTAEEWIGVRELTRAEWGNLSGIKAFRVEKTFPMTPGTLDNTLWLSAHMDFILSPVFAFPSLMQDHHKLDLTLLDSF